MARLADGKTPEQVLVYLRGVRFPAKKDDLVHAARQAGAPNDVVAALQRLPRTELTNADEVIQLYPTL